MRIPGQVVEAAIAACPHRGRRPSASPTSTRASCTSTRAPASVAIRPRPTPVTREARGRAAAHRQLRRRRPADRRAGRHSGRARLEAALLTRARASAPRRPAAGSARLRRARRLRIAGSLDALRDEAVVRLRHLPGGPLKLPRRHGGDRRARAAGLPGRRSSRWRMAGGSAPVDSAGHAGRGQRGGAVRHHAGAAHRARRSGRRMGRSRRCHGPALRLRLGGSPELALIGAAVAQISRRYRLPSCIAGA